MLRGPNGSADSPDNVYHLGTPTLHRDPSSFEGARLFTSDYDGTKFITDEPAPGGVGVEGAYELGLNEIGGHKAVDLFRQQGGHQGRTPYEIVKACIPDAGEDDVSALTDRLVPIKLEHLLGNIGRPLPDGGIWPRPTEGFLNLWRLIYEARANGSLIDTADISAGHEEFLLKTYLAYDIPSPDILVTSDTVHQLSLSSLIVMSEFAKPAPGLMTIALDRWFELYDWASLDPATLSAARNKVFYTGDNEERDGGLARNSGVDFIHVPVSGSVEAWHAVARRLALGDTAIRGATAS